jgi:hypothetical protein
MPPGNAPYTALEAFQDYFPKTGGLIWPRISDCE